MVVCLVGGLGFVNMLCVIGFPIYFFWLVERWFWCWTKRGGLRHWFRTTLLVATGAKRSGAGLGVGFGTTFFIAGAGLVTVSSISGSLFSW